MNATWEKMGASPTIFDCTQDRSGERLLQGVLVFALAHDAAFRKDFCDWIGLSGECTRIEEDLPTGGQVRHDIVLRAEMDQKRIELMLWDGWMGSQQSHSDHIDVVIVPQTHNMDARNGALTGEPWMVRTWEQLTADLDAKQLAGALLKPLVPHFGMGGELAKMDAQNAFKESMVMERTRVDQFLAACCAWTEKPWGKFAATAKAASMTDGQTPYIGRYLEPTRQPENANKAWLGFVSANMKTDLVLCVPARVADELMIKPAMHDWRWEGWKVAHVIMPMGDKYTPEAVYGEIKDTLNKLSPEEESGIKAM